MSLKLDIEKHPERWGKEIVAAVEDYKNGEINSKRKFRKIAKNKMSEYYCNELIERYASLHAFNAEQKKRERKLKFKRYITKFLAAVFWLGTFFYVAADVIIKHGVGIGVTYFIAGIVFANVVFSLQNEESKKLRHENKELRQKNEILEERLKKE